LRWGHELNKLRFLFTFRNLGNNFFSKLPSIGLDGIVHLKTFNNPNLREFPGPDSFPHVRTLVLSYAYHCCQFSRSHSVFASSRENGDGGFGLDGSSMESPVLQEDVIYPTDKDDFNSALSNLNLTDVWAGFGTCIEKEIGKDKTEKDL
jgi:leucine-rich repeat-containing G protein-coupled receptor 6